jgi:hypothetical protein
VRGIGDAFIARGFEEKDVLAFLAEEQVQA